MIKEKRNNEKLLIKGLINGNHKHFRELYEMYSTELFDFSFKILKTQDEAEDIVQETFIKVWENRKTLKTEGSFKSFLSTIALNSIRRHFNELVKSTEFRDKLLLSLAQTKELKEDDPYEVLLTRLNELINKMPPKRRNVFREKKIHGKSAAEIAQQNGITIKTVEYHVSEAMKFLKKEFGASDIDGMLLFVLVNRLNKKYDTI